MQSNANTQHNEQSEKKEDNTKTNENVESTQPIHSDYDNAIDNKNKNDIGDNTNDESYNNNNNNNNNSDESELNTPLPKKDDLPPGSNLRRSARITHKKEEEKSKRSLDDDDDLLSSNPLSFSASTIQQAKPKRLKYSLDRLLEEKVSGLYDEVEKWTSLEEGNSTTTTKMEESEESKQTMEKMSKLVSFRDELAESEQVETVFNQSPVSTPFSLIIPDPIPEKHRSVVSKIQEMTKEARDGRELITIFDIIGAFVNKDNLDPFVSVLIQWVVDTMVSVRDLEGVCTNVAVIDKGVEIFDNYISQSGKKYAGLFQFPSPALALNDIAPNNLPTPNFNFWIPSFDFFVSLFSRFGVSIQVIESICNRTEFTESTTPVLISASTSTSRFPSYNFQAILYILQQSVTAFPTSFTPHQYASLIALISKIMIDPVLRALSSHLSSLLATLITNYHDIRVSSWKKDSFDLCELLYSSCSFNLSKLKFVKNIPIINDICYSLKRKFAVYTATRLLEIQMSEDLIEDRLSLSTITKLVKKFNLFEEYSGVVVACLIDIAFGSDKSMIKSRSEIKDLLAELRSVNNRIREVGGYDLIKTRLKDVVILLIGKASILESECNFSSQRTLFD